MNTTRSLALASSALAMCSAATALPQGGTAFDLPVRPGLGGLPGPFTPDVVAVEDFDGDGLVDLFTVGVAGTEPIAGVAKGIGPTTYGPPAPTIVPVPNANPAIADIDGDGAVDACLVVEGPGGRAIQVGRGGAPAQPGLFYPPSTPYAGPSVGVQLGDADADGDLDAFVLGASGSIEFYTWESGAFSATPTDTSIIPSGSFEVADLDGDGRTELLRISSSGEVTLFPGTPAGFGAGLTPFGPSGSPVLRIDVLDLDADGDMDVVVNRLTASLAYIGDGSLGFTEAELVPGQSGVTIALQLGDFTGDGVVDLIYAGGGPFPQPIADLWSAGPFPFAPGSPVASSSALGSARVADVDLDGRDDLVTAEGYLPSQGSGTLLGALESFVFGSGSPRTVGAVDVNGDGDLDLVSFGQRVDWRENDGSLDFQIVRPLDLSADRILGGVSGTFETGGGRVLVTLEDPSLVPGGNQAVARFYRPVGDGTFDLVHQIFTGLQIVAGPGPGPEIVRVLDIDQDGFSDIVTADQGATFEVYSGRPTMAFSSPARLGVTSEPGFGDLDGDGDLDAVGVQGAGDIKAWRLRTGFTFGIPSISSVTIANVPGALTARSGDMNGDGMDDVVVQTATDTILLPRLGPFVFGSPVVMYTALGADPERDIELVDVDQDGALDIVLSPFSSALTIGTMALLGDGAGGISAFVTVFDQVDRSLPQSFVDLDGDGDLDAVGVEQSFTNGTTTALIAENLDVQSIGTVACDPAALNSSGLAARIRAFGTTSATGPPFRLVAERMPPGTFGIFVGSMELSPMPVTPPGSAGLLCLGGSIGRYADPGQIGNSGTTGSFQLEIDPTQLRTSSALVPAVAGESWFFQAWYRDVVAGGPGSNFTNGVEIRFN